MKFNITINQYELSKNKDVTIQDSAVIDWLFTMCGSDNERITKKRIEGWTWVSLLHLIEDMPLLRIKTSSGASKLIKRVKMLGYIETKVDTKERKLYIKPTKKLRDLYFSKPHKSQVLKDASQVLGETSQVPQDLNHNTSINTLDHHINLIASGNEGPQKEEEAPFLFKEKLKLLKDSSRHDFKVIALYWSSKGFEFDNKDQYNSALKRELRAAGLLKGYSGTQIAQAIDYCKKNHPVWTLETVGKRVADLINKK